jgi:hypothetical protein
VHTSIPTNNLSHATQTYREPSATAPVIALQSDAEKILAVYADGTIRCWDVATGKSHYEMQGRSPQVTSLQFDETKLLVDGTHSVVVVHDFSETPTTADPEQLEYMIGGVMETDEGSDEGQGEGHGEHDTNGEGDEDEDDGYPSTTA